MRRSPSWIAYAALGPVSGPLAAGVVRNWRGGQRVLAGLYLAALIEVVVLMPVVLEHLLSVVRSA